MGFHQIQSGAVITRSIFFTKSSQNTPHSSPVRARYGVWFVIWHTDLYSASVNAVQEKISCYIWPRYNGTLLYVKCGLCMRRECQERFPRHWLQRKPLVSEPGMHHGTCLTHVPWCMSGSLIRRGGENVPGIPGACTTRFFTYLVRVPWVRGDGLSPVRKQAITFPSYHWLHEIGNTRDGIRRPRSSVYITT